jgi:hypothetical protein
MQYYTVFATHKATGKILNLTGCMKLTQPKANQLIEKIKKKGIYQDFTLVPKK